MERRKTICDENKVKRHCRYHLHLMHAFAYTVRCGAQGNTLAEQNAAEVAALGRFAFQAES